MGIFAKLIPDRAAGDLSGPHVVRDNMDPTQPRDNASSYSFARRNNNNGKWQGIPKNEPPPPVI
eukprot:CAMPEP_0173390452 /NCGR_PEP_ID=MMETSP1356-20130122/14938_1 /TAXON_ID=77927 ORGANISM="Hemiselmis virescens, Strain PCC157" /NCGR_SAMPLE_ID=MMETSP1356 /ASSEMBLY_ACC=CAM_ASM_000847 /LENGTH=63 /DNA_ID=CAMNT_0014347849 /DNA_START=12 /DNA_END=203 /DNA_ORIENTATION=+